MSDRNVVSRSLASLTWTLIAAALSVTACGETPPEETPSAASAQPAATATPAIPAAAAGAPAEETTPAEETVPTEEVSEAEEAPDASASKAPSTPVLRLAAVEPKPAPRSAFKEGIHYQRLSPTQPTEVGADQVEVVEVFWYGCSHCFALDPKLETWRVNAKAPYIEFRRVPAIWNDVTTFHGRVFYTAELLGKLEQLHTPIFREIHVNGNALNTMDKTKAFFASQGIAAADFDRAFASFVLEGKLQNAGVLARRYRVPGVPFFVINGKFTTDVQSAGGEDPLLLLIAELAAREHSGS